MTRYLEVIVEVPDEASVQATKDYCRDELQAMGGNRHPNDPLFHSVRVHSVKPVAFYMPNPKSPGKSTPQMLRIKLTDLKVIDQAAKLSGLTRASFIRSRAILAARLDIEHAETDRKR